MSKSLTFFVSSSLCLALLVGCNAGDDYQEYTEAPQSESVDHDHDHDHDHEHAAPHGGQLIELGDHEYNLELVFKADPRTLTAYVLDAHAENPLAIEQEEIELHVEAGDQEIEVMLPAAPQEGDAEGKSSRFEATGEAISESITGLEGLHGHAHVTINGNNYSGDLHSDHEHGDDHDHDDEDHDHGDAHDHEEDHADEPAAE